MDKNPLGDPQGWIASVERIGISNTVILILVLALGISIIFRGPGILSEINKIIGTILQHRRLRREVEDRISREQAKLRNAIEKRKVRALRKGKGHE